MFTEMPGGLEQIGLGQKEILRVLKMEILHRHLVVKIYVSEEESGLEIHQHRHSRCHKRKSNDPGRMQRVGREGKPGSCPEEETLGKPDALEAENPLSGATGVELESYRD